jgi:hypothetical protein
VGIHLGVLASYVLIAFVHVRPLAFRFTETLPRGERVDVLLHGWIINWTARQLLRAPWELFQANIFFPHPDTLAYTEHMVPEALPVAPVWLLTRDPVLTYNTAFLLTFVLGGWGTFLLVRRLTGNPWAAWVAGAFGCYFPAKRWSLAHINTIAVHWVPFAMLSLHRLLEKPKISRAATAGIMVALASLASAYYTVYLPLLLALGVPLIWWAERWPIDRRRVLTMALAALVAALVALPLLFPYLGAWTGGAEPARSFDLQVAGAADVAEFFILDSLFWSRFLVPDALDPLTTPFFPGAVAGFLLLAALFGRGAAPPLRKVAQATEDAPTAGPSGRLLSAAGYTSAIAFAFVLADHLVAHHRELAASRPGPAPPVLTLLILGALAISLVAAAEGRAFPAALRKAWRRFLASPRLARVYFAIAAFALLMSLGPRLKFFGYEGPPLPYHWIYLWMPGASALRAPYRAAILGQIFLAVVLGFGAAWLLSRRRLAGRSRIAAACVLVFVMVAETTGTALPLHEIPAPDDGFHAWLAEQPGEFGILEWPIARMMDDTAIGQWLSTYHWKHRVTGHNGRHPEDIQELHGLARQWPPGPVFLDTLRERFPVRFVVVDLARFDRATQRELTEEILPGIADWWRFERAFGNRRVYRVRNGGEGRDLERRFAGWMVRGEMVIELAEAVPAGPGWRLGAEVDGLRLPPVELSPGLTEVRVPLPPGPASTEPVWLSLSIEGPAGRTLRVDSIRFETPDGIVYP